MELVTLKTSSGTGGCVPPTASLNSCRAPRRTRRCRRRAGCAAAGLPEREAEARRTRNRVPEEVRPVAEPRRLAPHLSVGGRPGAGSSSSTRNRRPRPDRERTWRAGRPSTAIRHEASVQPGASLRNARSRPTGVATTSSRSPSASRRSPTRRGSAFGLTRVLDEPVP